jgi:P27 family predicted phage terminase small subunit
MTKGRSPKPDAAKSKSRGHRALPGKGASPSAEALPVGVELANTAPPVHLAPAAAEIWGVILSDMAVLRTLRGPDLPLVLAYCQAFAIHEEASDSIREHGALMEVPIMETNCEGDQVQVGTAVKPNPAVKMGREAATTMRQLSDVLGLNPLARIRGNLMEVAGQSLALGIRDRLLKQLGE